jgi:hypothetical protein
MKLPEITPDIFRRYGTPKYLIQQDSNGAKYWTAAAHQFTKLVLDQEGLTDAVWDGTYKCPVCEKVFYPQHLTQAHCSERCFQKACNPEGKGKGNEG